jgi:hypothetical protein
MGLFGLQRFGVRDSLGAGVQFAAVRDFRINLDDSAFALNGQVGFCGWQRCGGNLLDTAGVKYYANSAT